MVFNLDPDEQAVETLCSKKRKKDNYLPLIFMAITYKQLLVKRQEEEVNNDLKILSKQVIQWKMVFNPDPNKQAVEILFSKKRGKDNYPPLTFNGNNLQTVKSYY